MRAHIKLGRVLGVEIGLHLSWLVIAVLITLSLAQHFQLTNPEWTAPVTWGSAVITGILFFASIVIHELSHAAVAKANGLPVKSITLFALGGVAQIEREAREAKTEFKIGIVGPLTSFVIGGICLGLAYVSGWTAPDTPKAPLLSMLVWLGYINVLLAIFNMIPGFPLDGGRVLRAMIWWWTGSPGRSTRIAARIGQMVALGFIALGVYRFFGGEGIAGLWIAFIGWFLLEAAGASHAQTELADLLGGLRVGDVMARDCPAVEGNSNLQTFVEEDLLRTGNRCFIVVEKGAMTGLITPNEVKGVDRALWPFKTVSDVMRPLGEGHSVSPDTPLLEALETMGRDEVNQLPVMSNGRLGGVITRSRVLSFLQTRAELNR